MTVTNDRRQKLIVAAGARQTLVHPHLVPARVARDDRGRVRIVLQTQQVPTLVEVLASGPLEVRESLRLLYGVATAADALSGAGLVARDLTPERILVSPRVGGVLADAGIPLEVLPRDPSPDDWTSAYRSPEERAGLPIDGRSNVYSLAAVFLSTMTAADGEHVPLPAPAQAVIRRAMAEDRERRYGRCPEFVVTLAASFGLRRNAGRRSSLAPERQTRPTAPEHEDGPAANDPQPQPQAERLEQAPSAHASAAGTVADIITVADAAPLRSSRRPRPLRASQLARRNLDHTPRLSRSPDPPQGPGFEFRRCLVSAFRESRACRAFRGCRRCPSFACLQLRRLRRPVRITPTAVGIAAALLACLLVAVALGRILSSDDGSSRIGSSAFALALPSDWSEAKVARMGGISLASAVAAAPLGEDGAGLVVGAVPDMAELDRRFKAEGTRSEVGLGRLQAWRYAGLRPRLGLKATAYLAPTTGDSLLVICHARAADAPAVLPQCERIASTITLRGERPASLATREHPPSAAGACDRDTSPGAYARPSATCRDGPGGAPGQGSPRSETRVQRGCRQRVERRSARGSHHGESARRFPPRNGNRLWGARQGGG